MGQVSNLVVNCKLFAVISDDQNADGTRSTSIGLLEATPQVALINNPQSLLDLTSLGHGNELSIVTNVNESVLLEDGTQDGVENDRWGGVRDNTGLLVHLLGEKIDTKVSVLTSLGRRCDPDDLAGTLLQDHQVANADVVTRDGKGVVFAAVDRRDMTARGVTVPATREILLALVLDSLINGVVIDTVELMAVSMVTAVAAVMMRTVAGVAVVTVPFTHFVRVG